MSKVSDIPIVVAFTPNYLVPAATCIQSILKHSASTDRFEIIVLLSEALPVHMKEQLESLDTQRLHFSYLHLAGQLGDIYVDARYTEAASYRLLLPRLLPQYDKVIYIDCDVIVRNDLAALYRSIDLQNNYLAAVFEAALDSQVSYITSLGCTPGFYINSGFLLMNLALLRADHMVEQFLEAAKKPNLQFPDQDVLNQLCQGRILGLAPYYNSIRTYFLPQYKAEFLKRYTIADWEAVQRHGTIHYTGSKPWNSFTVQFGTWWNYYDELPTAIKQAWRPNPKIKALAKIYQTKMGSFVIDGVQTLYRKWNYG